MARKHEDTLVQRAILQESVKVTKKIEAFPRPLKTNELHQIDVMATFANDAELLQAKKDVQKMDDRLRSLLIGGTTVTALGGLCLTLPISDFAAITGISSGIGIIGGAYVFGKVTGVFKNAKQLPKLSNTFLNSLELQKDLDKLDKSTPSRHMRLNNLIKPPAHSLDSARTSQSSPPSSIIKDQGTLQKLRLEQLKEDRIHHIKPHIRKPLKFR